MSRRIVSSFWNEHASATRPGKRSRTNARISSGESASTSAGSCRLCIAEQHLLQRVAAQPEPERLERDHFLRRDVAEIDGRPELLDEPGLRRLRRCLEDDVHGADLER